MLIAAIPVRSQVVPSAMAGSPVAEARMRTPPPVNGEPLPTVTGAEVRSDYLNTEIRFRTSWYDNLLPGNSVRPVRDLAYSVNPRIEFNKTTPRLHQAWTYDPHFTLYQRATGLNAIDQSGSLDLSYRLSPHFTVSGRDTIQNGSNIFNRSSLGGEISGSTVVSSQDVIAPYAENFRNHGNAEVSYQYSASSMIGASGTTLLSNFPNQGQQISLADSAVLGGSVFFNHLLSGSQYTGAIYQFSREKDTLGNSQTDTTVNTINLYYTIYLAHALTLSMTAGAQRYNVRQEPLPQLASWTPAVMGSIVWQRDHASLAANYSRSVAGGGGLLGAFSTNKASGSTRWQLVRRWNAELTANYLIRKKVSLFSLSSNVGGHSVSGTAIIEHALSDHLRLSFEYERLHQSYGYIPLLSGNPDSDRGSISMSYQYARPLGR